MTTHRFRIVSTKLGTYRVQERLNQSDQWFFVSDDRAQARGFRANNFHSLDTASSFLDQTIASIMDEATNKRDENAKNIVNEVMLLSVIDTEKV